VDKALHRGFQLVEEGLVSSSPASEISTAYLMKKGVIEGFRLSTE